MLVVRGCIPMHHYIKNVSDFRHVGGTYAPPHARPLRGRISFVCWCIGCADAHPMHQHTKDP
ncbi:hypothetical protein KDAU_57050 [Dictyobacter aurantiacus]|uniref:Uncharacterized protein n=1 Tax=Dictyobacter aurantiacus TaxID=1936993 RepID=A0A401ZNP5_9CHLR|nr:hypothetical protein KDAU_57050 [Dictyobacter aurantiacus]